MRLRRAAVLFLTVIVAITVLSTSSLEPNDSTERVRAFTRNIEFDYVGWTLNAVRLKLLESSLGTANYLPDEARRQMVLHYLATVLQIQQVEDMLRTIYADPSIADPYAASRSLRGRLTALGAYRDQLAPVAEAVLESQISAVLAHEGLTLGGQPFPPVLYHTTPLPLALIVSPRNIIRMDENISLLPDLTVDKQVQLENRIDRALNVSSLVVEIGGQGTYPTMVQQTSNLNWLSEVIAHEWVHNYLTFRPLGINYMTSPELRVMNETVASIAGKEIGRAVLEQFYPELLPPPEQTGGQIGKPTEPPEFDFRKEMRLTRLTVDKLLAEGRVEEAERYMEMRRLVFWEHGYRFLRKLNQAYFAFHGAYADEPGAAGAVEDPIGAAVRTLRSQSPSLAAFLNRISWMTSFEQLKQAVEETK